MSDRAYKSDRKHDAHDRSSQRVREDKGAGSGQQGRQDHRERDRPPRSHDSQRQPHNQPAGRPGPPPSSARGPPAPQQGSSRSGSGPPSRPGLSTLGRGPTGPGGSGLALLIQEAKKRQEQQQRRTTTTAAASPDPDARDGSAAAASPALAAAGAGEEGKKRRHSPIPFSQPKRHAAGGRDSSGPPDSLGAPSWQDRLAQEQEEFARQLQLQQEEAAGGSSPQQQQQQQQRQRRTGPPCGYSSSPSDSGTESGEMERQPARGRWGADEEEAAAARGQAAGEGEGAAKGLKSRWLSAAGAGGEGTPSGDVEEGEAGPGEAATAAAELEEEEELNRREQEELEGQGEASESVPLSEGGGGSPGQLDPGEQSFEKSMLEECRSVDEYERLNQISEGTYGVVFRAREKSSGRAYALKKIKLDDFPHGFPQTSIREINILLSLHHRNIVNVLEVVVGGRANSQVFMVMEFVEHDLKDLQKRMKERGQEFSQAQVKCLLQQLLAGLGYLHEHWVIHRDLKTANLLYGNNGCLKICDFGMARQYGDPLRTYSQNVVTLYYRAIEKLLGMRKYSTALDMWSVGCIMAELLSGKVLFRPEKGVEGEMSTIITIVDTLGTPLEDGDPQHPRYWKGWRDQLPAMKTLKFTPKPSKLRQKFPAVNLATGAGLSDLGFDLMQRLLAWHPDNRISAKEALEHPWFRESPLPAQQELMPAYPSQAAGEVFR